MKTFQADEKKNKVTTICNILAALPDLRIATFRAIVPAEKYVMFLHIVTDIAPSLKHSVTIQEDMKVSVFLNKVKMTALRESCVFPDVIQDIRMLQTLLEDIEKFDRHCMPSCNRDSFAPDFSLLKALLDDMTNAALAPEELQETLQFLSEQVKLIKNVRLPLYLADLIVLASILFSISAHAYKFLRGSSKLLLPYPSTIRRICATFEVKPQKEQNAHDFLVYMGTRLKQL